MDDDDECAIPDFVMRLKEFVVDHFVTDHKWPDVVIVRMDHGGHLGVLPPAYLWGEPPQMGHIGTSAFVVRRDVWNATRQHWRADYCGDYYYIAEVWQQGRNFVWWDIVASRTQRGHSTGAPE